MGERYDCTECKETLFGQKYILKDENPFCIKCYEALFSNTCEVCQKLIGSTSKVPAAQASSQLSLGRRADCCVVALSAGSVVQGPALAQRMFPVPQVQPLSGGPALRHQGRHAHVHRVLQQWVLSQMSRLPQDHHARWECRPVLDLLECCRQLEQRSDQLQTAFSLSFMLLLIFYEILGGIQSPRFLCTC